MLVLNFIFMAGYLVRAAGFIIGKHVPLLDTLYILALALPPMVGYTIPVSILTAVMITYGNLSQNNELRAMRASGVHLFQVVMPALAIGVILSLGMFVFNDQVASNSRFELRRTTKKLFIKYPKAIIEPGRFVKLSDKIIFLTKRLEGDDLFDIVAYEVEETDKPVRTIIAERGQIVSAEAVNEMTVRLFNGSISNAEDKGVNTIQFQSYEFPPIDTKEIDRMRKKQKDLTLAEILIRLNDQANLSRKDIVRLKTAFHHRIAFSCASFIFVLIGVPIAILVRRGEIVVSFGISMGVTCIYYILFVGAKSLATQAGFPPFIVMWLPNVLLAFLGIHLIKRAVAA